MKVRTARWLARFRRIRGPLIRLWDADFNLVATQPIDVESWRHWLNRQARRPLGGRGVRIATDPTPGPGPGVVVLSPRLEVETSR